MFVRIMIHLLNLFIIFKSSVEEKPAEPEEDLDMGDLFG